eukprot:3754752-Rhodomonas_salina.3
MTGAECRVFPLVVERAWSWTRAAAAFDDLAVVEPVRVIQSKLPWQLQLSPQVPFPEQTVLVYDLRGVDAKVFPAEPVLRIVDAGAPWHRHRVAQQGQPPQILLLHHSSVHCQPDALVRQCQGLNPAPRFRQSRIRYWA